jgi:tetratricopeptide (TPR) repeat protein
LHIALAKLFVKKGSVSSVAFSPDFRRVAAGLSDRTARLWETPAELPDDVPRLKAWVEAMTGLELDVQGLVHPLASADWHERRERLKQMGGPPPTHTPRLLDPILFGREPTARADALLKLARWDEAEASYAEAVHAHPLRTAVWSARGRFYVLRAQPERAIANFVEATQLRPDDFELRKHHCLVLLAAGDRIALKNTLADLLDRFNDRANHDEAIRVCWICSLAPDAVTNVVEPLRRARRAMQGIAVEVTKPFALRTLGAGLYRAGQIEEAIRRFEEGIQLRDGMGLPEDWAFLAMAHHRMGHHDEARRWLDRLREHRTRDPDTFWSPSQGWAELEIRLLRSEAEAVILYDPVFPNDPFAH